MTRKDGLLALLVVVVWGLNFVVIKVGLHNMPPLMLAGLRFLLVAFPALLFVARPKIPLRLLLGYGLTISFGQFAFLFCAINLGMPAGLASLVLQAQAFFTIILGAFAFGERLQGKQLTVLSLLYLAFIATIVGYGIWGSLLGRYETWRVAPLSLLVPVVGMASAALLLGETLNGLQLLGAVLIMAGLYINVFGLRTWRTGVVPR